MTTDILLTLTSLFFAGNMWFAKRLVAGLDEFKKEVRGVLGIHTTSLARIDERHLLEDRQEFGRRRGDHPSHVR